MVGEDFYLLTEENVSILLQGLDDTEELSLSSSVSGLSRVQLSAIEGYRLVVLGDDSSQLVVTSICVNSKWLAEVRVG